MKITAKKTDILPVDVIVFSRERQKRLIRSLKLWSMQPYHFVILDNSEIPLETNFARNISYFHLRGQNFGSRANEAIKFLRNPYAIICSDDECLIPFSIHRMVDFLEKNRNFSSVGGRVIGAYKYGPRLTGVLAYSYMNGYVNRSKDINVRLRKHLISNFEGNRPIGGMYRLFRNEGMVKLLESFYFARNIPTPYIFEILGEIVSTSLGSTSTLTNVYWIRNWHDGMSNHSDWNRNYTFSSWWTNTSNQKAKIELMNWVCKTHGINFSVLSELLDEFVKRLLPFDDKVKYFNFKTSKNVFLEHKINLLKFLIKVLLVPTKIPKSLGVVLTEEVLPTSLKERSQIIDCAKAMIV